MVPSPKELWGRSKTGMTAGHYTVERGTLDVADIEAWPSWAFARMIPSSDFERMIPEVQDS